jgi:hypothetical protein
MQIPALNLLLLTPFNRQRIASFDSEGKTARDLRRMCVPPTKL